MPRTNTPAARPAFDEFVKLDDKRALAWSLLGLCEFETGKYDQAFDHLRRGLAAGKDLPPEVEAGVRFHYGLLLSRAGLFDQGKRELERYARGGAHEPMLIAGLGLNALHQTVAAQGSAGGADGCGDEGGRSGPFLDSRRNRSGGSRLSGVGRSSTQL